MPKLTPIERLALLALREPRYFYALHEDYRMVIPDLHHERGLVELRGPSHEAIYQLTDAGRAALATAAESRHSHADRATAIGEARRLGDSTPGDGWRRLLWRMADLLEGKDTL